MEPLPTRAADSLRSANDPRAKPVKTGRVNTIPTSGVMKTRFSKLVRFVSVLWFTVWAVGSQCSAQTSPVLGIQLYAGLSITGAVGTVYSIEYVTDLAQTNTPSA